MIAVIASLMLGAAAQPNYLCNYAKISVPSGVIVRSQHADRSRPTTRLAPGTVVYVCDEARGDAGSDKWLQVSFADLRHRCGGSTAGLLVNSAASCRKGWVRARYVDVLSG
jgi:hypothetical protein